MEVNEETMTVTISKLHMHRHMKSVWDMIAAGYEVVVMGHGVPVAKISKVAVKWDGKGFVSE